MPEPKTAYMLVYAQDPFTRERVAVGAFIVAENRYIARSKVPATFTGSKKRHLALIMDRLKQQEHPWEITAEYCLSERVYFAFGEGQEADAWIRATLAKSSLFPESHE